MRTSRILPRLCAGATLSILLASCAQPLGHGPVDWDHGARRGRVLELLDAGAAADAVHACVAAAPVQGRYARVRYRGTHLHHTVVAALPDGIDALPGAEVELWPAHCADGHVARVERVLAPPAPGGNAS